MSFMTICCISDNLIWCKYTITVYSNQVIDVWKPLDLATLVGMLCIFRKRIYNFCYFFCYVIHLYTYKQKENNKHTKQLQKKKKKKKKKKYHNLTIHNMYIHARYFASTRVSLSLRNEIKEQVQGDTKHQTCRLVNAIYTISNPNFTYN